MQANTHPIKYPATKVTTKRITALVKLNGNTLIESDTWCRPNIQSRYACPNPDQTIASQTKCINETNEPTTSAVFPALSFIFSPPFYLLFRIKNDKLSKDAKLTHARYG